MPYVLVPAGSMPKIPQEQRSKHLILEKPDRTDSVEPAHRVSPILLLSPRLLLNIPFDQMQARLRLYNAAYLARLQGESSFLEFLLHLAFPKEAPANWSALARRLLTKFQSSQISSFFRTVAVTLRRRQVPQPDLPILNPLLEPLQNLSRLFFTSGDILILPTAWPPALPMLHQQMRRTDLARRRLGGEGLSNVFAQFFCVRAGRRLPFRLLGRCIEKIGKIL